MGRKQEEVAGEEKRCISPEGSKVGDAGKGVFDPMAWKRGKGHASADGFDFNAQAHWGEDGTWFPPGLNPITRQFIDPAYRDAWEQGFVWSAAQQAWREYSELSLAPPQSPALGELERAAPSSSMDETACAERSELPDIVDVPPAPEELEWGTASQREEQIGIAIEPAQSAGASDQAEQMPELVEAVVIEPELAEDADSDDALPTEWGGLSTASRDEEERRSPQAPQPTSWFGVAAGVRETLAAGEGYSGGSSTQSAAEQQDDGAAPTIMLPAEASVAETGRIPTLTSEDVDLGTLAWGVDAIRAEQGRRGAFAHDELGAIAPVIEVGESDIYAEPEALSSGAPIGRRPSAAQTQAEWQLAPAMTLTPIPTPVPTKGIPPSFSARTAAPSVAPQTITPHPMPADTQWGEGWGKVVTPAPTPSEKQPPSARDAAASRRSFEGQAANIATTGEFKLPGWSRESNPFIVNMSSRAAAPGSTGAMSPLEDWTRSIAPPSPISIGRAASLPEHPESCGLPGEHRVIVHTIDGQVRRGMLRDANFLGEALELVLDGGVEVERFAITRLKAVFVLLAPGATVARKGKQRMTVTFVDDRQVAGVTNDYDPQAPGFFLTPLDERSNTARVFIYLAGVKGIMLG